MLVGICGTCGFDFLGKHVGLKYRRQIQRGAGTSLNQKMAREFQMGLKHCMGSDNYENQSQCLEKGNHHPFIWHHLGAIWQHLGASESRWQQLAACTASWHHLAPSGGIWQHLAPSGLPGKEIRALGPGNLEKVIISIKLSDIIQK